MPKKKAKCAKSPKVQTMVIRGVPVDVLKRVDACAAEMGLSRTRYVTFLLQDVAASTEAARSSPMLQHFESLLERALQSKGGA